MGKRASLVNIITSVKIQDHTGNTEPLADCPTHMTLIFSLWYLSVFHYKYERNTAGKSANDVLPNMDVLY